MKPLNFILLSLFCLSANCFGDIIPTNDFKVIEECVNKADKDTLVIFDVDDVLVMPTDEFAFNAPVRKEIFNKQLLKDKYSEDELKYLFMYGPPVECKKKITSIIKKQMQSCIRLIADKST